MSDLRIKDMMPPPRMGGLTPPPMAGVRAPRMSTVLPRSDASIVPKSSIAGRALVAVVAIMAFLSSLTIGAVMLVRSAAMEWQGDVSREITIQVRPMTGRAMDADVDRAAEIARGTPGIAGVRPFSRDESARLLEPWLGLGLALDDLPVPRVIVVRLSPDATVDIAQLRTVLTQSVPGASLDDHRAWIERMRSVSNTSVAAGIGVLILMMAATVLSVAFATRGAMATNHAIVEVLHFVGAKDKFIAGQFQRHFLLLGLEGGAIGGGLAILVFALASAFANWGRGAFGSDQLSLMFGSFSIGIGGYLVVLGQIALISMVTALTSRHTVNRTLAAIE